MLRHYIPSFSELYKSFRLRSKEYLRENTLHGFPYFVNPTRPTWERVIWLICTVASICAALGIIVTIWQRFQSTPTLVGLNVQTDQSEITYPSVNLCMTSDYLDLSRVPESLANIYLAYYNWNWNPVVNVSQLKVHQALTDVFLQITPDCDNVLADCVDRSFPTICSHLFKKIITPAGVCCQSSARPLKREGEFKQIGLEFVIQHKKLLNLYLQPMDDDPPLRDGPITYRLNRNVSTLITFAVTEAAAGLRFLTRSQRECVFHDEAPSYNNCVLQCMKKTIRKACGCLPWFISATRHEQCTLDQYSCLVDQRQRLNHPQCISDCYIYCDHTTYEFRQINNHDKTSIGTMWPSISFKREIQFGWLDLLVSFGGIMGVFLGYSVLTTVELSYYFSLRFYCGAVVNEDDTDRFKTIRVAEKQRKKPEMFEEWYYDYVD